MNASLNLSEILDKLPAYIKVVAVSKTKPVETIRKVYDQGYRIFGENKVQELAGKHPQLPDDIQWHFIGHLQRNKVKLIAPFVHMIHSIDSLRLLAEVNKQAQKANRIVNCLLQFHIAREDTKFGLDLDEASNILDSADFKAMENVMICGVMGMGTFTEDETIVREEFKTLKAVFDRLKTDYFSASESFCEISMGMSGDYALAIEEGSTMVRIGSAIFGERNYQ